MSATSLTTIKYQGACGQVNWRGLSFDNVNDFDTFVTGHVASRLRDEEGHVVFATHLRGLANTGFARTSLDAILAAEVPEERDWAVGEALAEAVLSHDFLVTWPWNTERDKRHPRASLPGADLVGFIITGNQSRLALGEVKTSTDATSPPGVMNGRSGMAHQIDSLASDLSLLCQLLKWLLPRCKGTPHEVRFNDAVTSLLQSGNREVVLFGVLIRDTQPNELDFQSRGKSLSTRLHSPTVCHLIALHLPCPINELPLRVSGGSP